MKIELNIEDDTFDQLMKDVLIKDYRNLNDSISNWYEQHLDIEPYDIPSFKVEDLHNDIRFRDALEVILEYYLTSEEYKEKVLEIND